MAGKLCGAKWRLSKCPRQPVRAGPTVEPAWLCLISALLKTTVTNAAFHKNINTMDVQLPRQLFKMQTEFKPFPFDTLHKY